MRLKSFSFFVTGVVLFCISVFLRSSLIAAVDIRAGEPGKIMLSIETPARAGEFFSVKVEVRDIYDNVITNYHQMGRPLKLTTSGKGKLSPDVIVPSEFIGGIAKINFTYNKAEKITITATEEISGKGNSVEVIVEPGRVNQFFVVAPPSVVTGQSFSLKIEAYDICGNLVTNYSSKYKGVEVAVGTGKLVPNFIPSSSFINGVASVEVMCTKAQVSTIYVMDITELAYGKSQIIKIEPSEVKRFLVSTPMQGVAGEAFTVRIEAYDAFGNLATNYDKVGRGVIITPKGQGKISPNEIPASVFINGIATVSLVYDRAEPLELLITEKPVQLPVAKPEEKIEKPIEVTKPAKKEVAKPSVEERKEVAPAVEKSKEEVDPKAEAKQCYERAVNAINLNKYDEAKKELERCVALDPNHTEAKKLLDRLNVIIKLETR